MESNQTTKTACGYGHKRQPTFSVLIKKKYKFILNKKELVPSDISPVFIEQDCYQGIGNPQINSVFKESDTSPFKPQTDVVLIGNIKTYQKKELTELDVGVQVKDIGKIIRLLGDRECLYKKDDKPIFSPPKPFIEMPLSYERAYGGKDKITNPDEEPLFYPRNPIGTAYAVSNMPELIEGLKLPNFEDRNDLLTPDNIILENPENWNKQPLPQGFGWVSKNTYPRFCNVGLIPPYLEIDEIPREAALGLVPEDLIALSRQFKLPSFDVRFTNGASLGMSFPYLQPKTKIKLAYMFKEQNIVEFLIPEKQPKYVQLDLGEGYKKLTTQIQTVSIDLDKKEVDIVWQACQKLESMSVFSTISALDYEVINE